ncbi:hypothetical protein CN684_24425 [Bacillus wiedmannii]|uniref:Uncharacterized protein n=1 Tax=Bacillus wiedmannii TaxID=1890302 RepID=A0A2A7VU15_9BACI|nr:hypothetical protein CN684_24425 [Bacillus wiedmannii]PEM28118.1 hypothetical protein CN617_14475 [Bacillus wiedmannii]PHC71331.1 hypothetical protein COF35_03320 [Bacillus wiedmannii]
MFYNIKRYVPIIPFLIILSLFQCIAYGFDINFLKLYVLFPDGGIRYYLTSTLIPLVLAYIVDLFLNIQSLNKEVHILWNFIKN